MSQLLQSFSWCFAAPVFAFLAFLAIAAGTLAIIYHLRNKEEGQASQAAQDDQDAAPEVHPVTESTTIAGPVKRVECPGCSRRIKFTPIRTVRVRCSCGNVTDRPKKGNKVRCPRCDQAIHLSPRELAVKVRCPCGNVMEHQA